MRRLARLLTLTLAIAGCAGSTPMPSADPDQDGDGVADGSDLCPTERGDGQDGCPEHGRVWSTEDAFGSSTEAVTPNDQAHARVWSTEDAFGPSDQDGDGISDSADYCPKEAEDKDGYEDSDGCPDPDNDKDGVPDERDSCVDQPETRNGFQDEDGCPDEKVKSLQLPASAPDPRPAPSRAPEVGAVASAPIAPIAPSVQPGSRPIAVATGERERWVIAVMDVLVGPEVKADRNLPRGLTDQLRALLGERRFRVIDRGTQEAALKRLLSEEKKKSYAACVDASCQVPLGKELAASHIVRVSIARFDTICALSGELFDLKTDATATGSKVRCGCSGSQILDGMEALVDNVVRQTAN